MPDPYWESDRTCAKMEHCEGCARWVERGYGAAGKGVCGQIYYLARRGGKDGVGNRLWASSEGG